ncbi:MAG: hypothetical protein M3460_20075 [Actinomycetota bacterium]|nr:hypothetical protein [Actinomycetota bacterium]
MQGSEVNPSVAQGDESAVDDGAGRQLRGEGVGDVGEQGGQAALPAGLQVGPPLSEPAVRRGD